MIAALHPAPREVLEIGMSGGSWARVVVGYEPVKKLTAIEINPGYLELIRRYDQQRPLLEDPKLTVHIDDGRRWLNRNPDAKFDFILQNTTFHWRSHVTNLISEEYLRLCKRHLKPGGVMYCNTTGSPNIPYTGARVFKHVVRYGSFAAFSDAPFSLSPEQVRANLRKFTDGGAAVFTGERGREVLEEMAAAKLEDQGPALRARSDLLHITDDNMATEYKRVGWFNPGRSWWALLRRLPKGA